MGSLLLQSPWVHFYVLYVAVLWTVFVWDYIRNRSTSRLRVQIAPKDVAQGMEPISEKKRA